jgi:hypothetical protein
MNLNDTPWQLPIMQDLTQWHVITSQFARTIRNLHEIVFMTALLNKTLELKPENFFKITQRIPFFRECNVTVGVIAANILEYSIPLKDLSSSFPSCVDPLKDITIGMDFWAQTVKIFKTDLPEFKQLNTDFEIANQFLIKKIASLQK